MTIDYDAVILGGTVQGREAAALAVREGARVALVEPPGTVDLGLRRQILLAALAGAADSTPWADLKRQVSALEAVAYPQLSLDRLATSGVDVVLEPGQFSPRPQLAVTTATRRIRGRGYLLAPGTDVTVPDIPGLAETPFLTVDKLLTLDALPESAIVLGRSGTAIALAQALARLGTRTTLVSRGHTLLPTEDPDLAAFVAALLEAAGVSLRLAAPIDGVRQPDNSVELRLGQGAIAAQTLILATAPHPTLAHLNLESIGIRPRRVYGTAVALPVDDRLVTAHRRVFACGPGLGGYWAETTDHQDVAIALRNLLYLPWRQLSVLNRPALLPTRPEYARVGLAATQAQRWYGGDATVLQVPLGQVLKAHCGPDILGFCRCTVRADGHILGAQICGAGASDLIHALTQAQHQGIPLHRLERLPTLPHSLSAILPLLGAAWQQQRWRPGTWQRDWAENWFNWRRSRPRR
ncbi:FAD-dependent oxidoreductase [Leptolyngbya sp. KIOST-1]|uniref:FAD-dependent oxidoreductase n=1 Tax=Leptolyngbya sp. KIOST-1 TaxID=1229172 RepID=UPI000567F129|nr:FAD-dependent oxidoreductase [Leptolyngbya sp. KIOST-1]